MGEVKDKAGKVIIFLWRTREEFDAWKSPTTVLLPDCRMLTVSVKFLCGEDPECKMISASHRAALDANPESFVGMLAIGKEQNLSDVVAFYSRVLGSRRSVVM